MLFVLSIFTPSLYVPSLLISACAFLRFGPLLYAQHTASCSLWVLPFTVLASSALLELWTASCLRCFPTLAMHPCYSMRHLPPIIVSPSSSRISRPSALHASRHCVTSFSDISHDHSRFPSSFYHYGAIHMHLLFSPSSRFRAPTRLCVLSACVYVLPLLDAATPSLQPRLKCACTYNQ